MRAEGGCGWAMAVAIALAVSIGGAIPALAQSAPIAPLPRFDGTWYEVASFGTWGQRQCSTGTIFELAARSATEATLRSRCRTASGLELRNGRVRAEDDQGRWRARFAPRVFGWLPGAWGDFWVLGTRPGAQLVRRRRARPSTPVDRLAHGGARRGGARPRAGAGASCRIRRRTAGAGDSRRRRLAQPTAGTRSLAESQRRSRLRRSSSSRVRGQSPFRSRDNPRSASRRPSVWQVGQ